MASSSSSLHLAPASPSSSSQSCDYDVFLSFRGEDTRKTFVDYLYSTLVDRMIYTYKDDETLPRGDSIRPSLFNAIEGSRIAVVIFSENYANSSWCLDELAHIMKCTDERKLIVMPIFYCVDPSEVRKQKGTFGEAFAKHEMENSRSKVESWRDALVRATEIAGWELKNIANGHEMKAIKVIVNTISAKLVSLNSNVDEELVGMRIRVQELEAQLEIGSPGVRMIGIWGGGGSGKTTLATSLCMKVSGHFQDHCIVDNVREESRKHGLNNLQKKIISRLLKTDSEVQNVQEGKQIIRGSRLSRSKVLILLDDIDHIDQLDALAGSHNWFGSGSRIIITTRNEQLLLCHKVDKVCSVTLLSPEEAIELFNKRAYNERKPLTDYEKLSLEVVSYAARLPLALKVLGSFLYDKDEKEWRSTLDRLKYAPHSEILEQLKISYDGLENEEKELFLDIACFFTRHMSMESAIEIFEACGYRHDIGIRVLRQKALITIVNGMFDMHDLIQEMGHYIVRQEHPNDPAMHSRVWKCEEIENMCLAGATMGNDKIKGIQYLHPHDGYISSFFKNISNMKKLRYLEVSTLDDVSNVKGPSFRRISNELYLELSTLDDVSDVNVSDVKGPSFLSNELCYIEWKNYPRRPFPNSFKPMKLVTLKLHYGLQKRLWNGYKNIPNLKVLLLSDMKNLLSTPDFDGLPLLQKLILKDCERLKKIHPSLGNHKSLEYVSVVDCEKIKKFPTIVQMGKLKTLKIHFYSKIVNQVEFPKVESNMESLVELSLKSMYIDTLLSSIGERCPNLLSVELYLCRIKESEANFDGLRHLETFTLYGLRYHYMPSSYLCMICLDTRYEIAPFVLPQFTHLRKLNVGNCGLTDGTMPSDIGEIFNLEELNLGNNDVTRLDFSLSKLTRLKVLDICYCRQLLELSELPSGLIILRAEYCHSLTIVEDCFTNCKCLCDVSLKGYGDHLPKSMLQGKAVENHCMVLTHEGYEIEKLLITPLVKDKERGYTLKLPENWRDYFFGFLMWGSLHNDSVYPLKISIKQVMSGMESHNDVVLEVNSYGVGEFKTVVAYIPFASLRHTKWWDEPHKEVMFCIENRSVSWKGIVVRLVAKKSGNGPTEKSTPQEEQDFSHYAPSIRIEHDSQCALEFWFQPFEDLIEKWKWSNRKVNTTRTRLLSLCT